MTSTNYRSDGRTVQLIDTNGEPFDILQEDGAITVRDYLEAISEGDVPNHSLWRKIGYSNASTGSQTTLWNPGTEYVFPAANISVEVVSTSANDTSAGSGAQTMHLTYLDSTYTEKTHTFTMNGTTPVAGPTDFYRVNTFHVESGLQAAGVISLRLVGGAATVYSQCASGYTRSRNSVYTVPLGKTVHICSVLFTAAYSTSGKSVRMTLHTSRSPDEVVLTSGTLFYPELEMMLVDNIGAMPNKVVLKLPEKTDIKVSVIGETNAKCTSFMHGWIE